MSAGKRTHQVPLGAEVALAFLAGTATFALVAVVLAGIESDLVIVLVGVPYVAAIVAVARTWGVAYAVPMAMAGLLAYDWYYLPPTHPLEFPDSANLVDLLVFLAVAVLIGQLAASSTRRADVSEADLARLADEQAALRRVATLVARGVPPPEVFAAVAREVGQLLEVDLTHVTRYEPDDTAIGVGSWSRKGDHLPVGTRATLDGTSVTSLVLQTGQPARLDSYEDEAMGSITDRLRRDLEVRSSVGAPIVVEGHLWGVMIASSKEEQPLPAETESRIAAFTELVATAISNTEARTETAQLADEQAALRRVATLVAQAVPRSELFAAVAEEVGRLLGGDLAGMIRYESDGTVMAVATWAAEGEHPVVPGPWPLEGGAATMAKTGRSVREDDWTDVPGPIAAFVREAGVRSSVGSPIVVGERVWGALIVHSKQQTQPLPRHTERRLTNFAELVATAISNAEARTETARLANEQAALRRVATLVARESPSEEVFAAVAEELGRLLLVEGTRVIRYEGDETATLLASWGDVSDFPVGTRGPLGPDNVGGRVFQTGQPARVNDFSKASRSLAARARSVGVRSAVGSPIVVEGRLWGAMIAVSRQAEPLPSDTESRIGKFTELVATAISNMQARSELASSRARIVAATDAERRRVVRDLHDGAQQRLVHTVVTLKLARDALQQEDEASRLVTEALDQAERATVELRELAHGILPSVLTRGGLRAGAEALASRMPVPVEIGVSVGRLPAAVEATAYFLVAEALTNVAKHSRAGHAAVMARVEDSTLRVQVRDDGVGGARPDGSGLVGLRDRLAALDGRLWVESPPDGGTLVAAAIPFSGSPGKGRS